MRKRRQLSRREQITIKDLYGGCVFCAPGKLSMRYHFDHFDPWSKSHDDLISNFVVACENHNLAKRDQDPQVWFNLMKTVNHPAYIIFCGFNGVPIPVEVRERVIERVVEVEKKKPDEPFPNVSPPVGPLAKNHPLDEIMSMSQPRRKTGVRLTYFDAEGKPTVTSDD